MELQSLDPARMTTLELQAFGWHADSTGQLQRLVGVKRPVGGGIRDQMNLLDAEHSPYT